MVTLGIVSPRKLFRKAIGALLLSLSMGEELTICLDTDSFADALAQMVSTKPQVLLIDCENTQSCFSYVRRIREISPLTKCLLLTETAGNESEAQAAHCGAWGLITGQADQELLQRAIQKVLSGEMWFSPATMARTVESFMQRKYPDNSVHERLTVREAEITALLAKGLQNKEIAQQLLISENTVRRYTEAIYRKLRVNSRVQLTVWYYQRAEHQ